MVTPVGGPDAEALMVVAEVGFAQTGYFTHPLSVGAAE
jgi:hypothetical protein